MHPVQAKSTRWWYLLATLATLVALVAIRFLAVPVETNAATWFVTLGALLDAFITALAAALVLAVIYLLFLEPKPDALSTVDYRQIGRVLREEVEGATEWSIRARTANYFCRETLPRLVDKSLADHSALRIRVLMLDPSDDALLDQYVAFRGAEAHDGQPWSRARVRCDIHASLLLIGVQAARNPRLEIEVGFSSAFWTLSQDMSQKMILVTGQYKGDPAIRLGSDGVHYNSWRDDFDALMSIARRYVVTPAICASVTSAAILGDLQALNSYWEEFGLTPVSSNEVGRIETLVKEGHHYR